MPSKPINLAVLISGSGRTLQNFVELIGAGKLNAKIVLVIASKSGIGGIERAKQAGLECAVVEPKAFDSAAAFSGEIFRLCDRAGAELVCLAGWLWLLEIPPRYSGRVMNIHPALLPEFGGKGMYGHHVHEAVLKSKKTQSGCTVHFVDNQYDHGKIILRRTCRVEADDSAQSLAERIFEEEKIAYPEAIRMYQAGRTGASVA